MFTLHVPNPLTGEAEIVRKFDSPAHARRYVELEFDPFLTPLYAIQDDRPPIVLTDEDIVDDFRDNNEPC